MQYKLATLIAVGLGTTQAVAYSHGERSEYHGKEIRWQQLAEGVFTGVSADEWDDSIHKRGFQEWDVEEIMSLKRDAPAVQGRDLELEARNLSPRCQAVFNCLKDTGDAVLSGALGAYFQIAAYAANGTPGKDLMTFLNQPFVANAAGVAVAGVISGQINEATKKECSTSGSQEDVLNAAVSAAIAKAPTSGAISVTVNGPSGSWSIDVHAKPEGQNPVPQCFEA